MSEEKLSGTNRVRAFLVAPQIGIAIVTKHNKSLLTVCSALLVIAKIAKICTSKKQKKWAGLNFWMFILLWP